MKLKDITAVLESAVPLALQESYDNAGLIVGDPAREITSALLTLDVTEEVLEEAERKNCNLIIAHHPILFSGLKKIIGKSYVERIVIKAIKKDIALYAMHTNLDSVDFGISYKLAEKLGLKDISVLKPQGELKKLVVFVPHNQAENVRNAMFDAGAGHIGNYDSCSYNLEGKGSFRALENANPYVGKKGGVHFEGETRIETVFPEYLTSKIVREMISAHPYEEVAYDIYKLDQVNPKTGMGMIACYEKAMPVKEFLNKVKKELNVSVLRHTKIVTDKVQRVAVCGGSGSFLIQDAIRKKADVLITGDIKYHQFFDADDKIILVDAGHYETEQFAKEIFYDLLTKKIPKFALQFSEVNTNVINYF
ncbi:MAG: Nif3-like dinuclear metal center hexameric protein [Marinilabiliales bacterium]|nr:MAG: Nif3-like dinuclear metal center hexameric protein [Marinilabiliales bacterium]